MSVHVGHGITGLRLATAGIVVGCFLGWLAGLALRHLVVGVGAANLLTFTTVAATLFAVAAMASLLPASPRRAWM